MFYAYLISTLKFQFEKIDKQAGAELGQAQLQLC